MHREENKGRNLKHFIILFFLFIQINAEAESAPSLHSLKEIKLAADLEWKPNIILSKIYDDTQCKNVVRKKTKKNIGFFCLSSNREFLKDMGITEETEQLASPQSNLEKELFFISSAINQYKAENFVKTDTIQSYAAEVDCDESKSEIYRPTSICHITISTPQNGFYIYSNFVLENRATKKKNIDINEIKTIWFSIK
jgi:hypothetical protein